MNWKKEIGKSVRLKAYRLDLNTISWKNRIGIWRIKLNIVWTFYKIRYLHKRNIVLYVGWYQGLGSRLCRIIYWMDFLKKFWILRHCVNIQFYFEGKDYFPDLLTLNTQRKAKRKECIVSLESFFEDSMSLKKAARLINRYLTPSVEVQNKVDAFYDKHFKGRKVMGVHYRGSDKSIREANRISYDKVLENIRFYKQKFSLDAIFVMSDEKRFVDYLNNTSLKELIIHHPDSTYSDDGHWGAAIKSDGKFLLQNALMDCLLLSKCDFIIKTSSNLSAFSKMINPDIPTVFLHEGGENRITYELEIMETSLPPVSAPPPQTGQQKSENITEWQRNRAGRLPGIAESQKKTGQQSRPAQVSLVLKPQPKPRLPFFVHTKGS